MKENEDLSPIILKDEMLKFFRGTVYVDQKFQRCPFCESTMMGNFVFHICGTEPNDIDREDWIQCPDCHGYMIFMGGRMLEPWLAHKISQMDHCTCVIPIYLQTNMINQDEFFKFRNLRNKNVQSN